MWYLSEKNPYNVGVDLDLDLDQGSDPGFLFPPFSSNMARSASFQGILIYFFSIRHECLIIYECRFIGADSRINPDPVNLNVVS